VDQETKAHLLRLSGLFSSLDTVAESQSVATPGCGDTFDGAAVRLVLIVPRNSEGNGEVDMAYTNAIYSRNGRNLVDVFHSLFRLD
jgi:hypothetical protein